MVETGELPLTQSGTRPRFPMGPIALILGIELCERLCYYTIAGTLRNYVQEAGFSLSDSSALTATFGTIGWGMCLPGGIISDKIGLYPTIFAACAIYVFGTSMVTLAAIPPVGVPIKTALYLFSACILVSFGMGGIKPNIMNFGASQITAEGEEADKQRESFFSYFYISINVGVFGAFLYLVTLATSGQPPLVPKDWGYFAAYLIATIAMAIAGVLYVSGTKIYVRNKPTPPPENEILVVFRTLAHTAKQGNTKAKLALFGWAAIPVFILTSMLASFPFAKPLQNFFTWFSLACGLISCCLVGVLHMDNSWVVARPSASDSEDAFSVQEVRGTLRCIPLMLLINISFNLCYNSMNAAFPAQACQMNCFISGDTQLNGAFFNVGDAFGIVIFAPLFEAFLFPTWTKIQGRSVSLGQKLMVGLFIVALANLVGAALEIARKAAPLMTDRPTSDCAPPDTYMNDISAFLMFIPFAMIGIAEIFVMPSMYYYAFEAAPKKVRATLQAFNLVAQGSISNAFTAGLQLVLVPNNLNTGNLCLYYYVNTIVAFLGMGLYFLYRRKVGSSRDFAKALDLDTPGNNHSNSLVHSFAKAGALTVDHNEGRT